MLCDDYYARYLGALGSGKTWLLTLRALLWAMDGEQVLYLLPNFRMIRDVTIPTLKEHLVTLGLAPMVEITMQPPTLTYLGKGTIMMRSAHKPDSLRGINASKGCLDEAGYIDLKAKEIFEARIRVGEKPQIRAVGTASGLTHWFSNLDCYTVKQSTLENPYLSDDYKFNIIKQYGGLDSLWARQELLGEVVDMSGSNTLIQPSLVKAAMMREYVIDKSELVICGIDVARYGGDATGFVIRQGSHVLFAKEFRDLEIYQTIEIIRGLAIEYLVDVCSVDAIGVGEDTPSVIKREIPGMKTVASKSSHSAPKKYFNKRAHLADKVRQWFTDGSLHEVANELNWVESLSCVTYVANDDNGKMRIDSKEEWRRRGIKSPNIFDAFALTFDPALDNIGKKQAADAGLPSQADRLRGGSVMDC